MNQGGRICPLQQISQQFEKIIHAIEWAKMVNELLNEVKIQPALAIDEGVEQASNQVRRDRQPIESVANNIFDLCQGDHRKTIVREAIVLVVLDFTAVNVGVQLVVIVVREALDGGIKPNNLRA